MCRDWVGFQKVIEEAADAFGHVCSRAVKARMHLGMLHAALLHVVFWTLAFWSGGGAGRVFGLSVFPACSALVACWSLVLDQCRVGLVLWAASRSFFLLRLACLLAPVAASSPRSPDFGAVNFWRLSAFCI